jgi:hypothetical protein
MGGVRMIRKKKRFIFLLLSFFTPIYFLADGLPVNIEWLTLPIAIGVLALAYWLTESSYLNLLRRAIRKAFGSHKESLKKYIDDE